MDNAKPRSANSNGAPSCVESALAARNVIVPHIQWICGHDESPNKDPEREGSHAQRTQ